MIEVGPTTRRREFVNGRFNVSVTDTLTFSGKKTYNVTLTRLDDHHVCCVLDVDDLNTLTDLLVYVRDHMED